MVNQIEIFNVLKGYTIYYMYTTVWYSEVTELSNAGRHLFSLTEMRTNRKDGNSVDVPHRVMLTGAWQV